MKGKGDNSRPEMTDIWTRVHWEFKGEKEHSFRMFLLALLINIGKGQVKKNKR